MEKLIRDVFFITLLLGMITIGVKSDDGGTYDDDHYGVVKAKKKSNPSSAWLYNLLHSTGEDLEDAGGGGGGGSGVFDVTKFGAKADGKTDGTQAFQATWQAVCAFNGKPRFVIPTGTFLVGEITFEGPCKNTGAIMIEVIGNLVAPGSIAAFKETSWITFNDVKGFVIKGGGTFDGKGGEEAWQKTNCPKTNKCRIPPSTLKVISCSDGEISGLNFKDAKAFNMRINKSNNLKLHGLRITCPGESPNTDGIHLSDCTNVKIYDSDIGVGDDCISIGDGNNDIDISGINCGPGHGISIGSLGKYKGEQPVSGIYIHNCTLTGTDNGVRIKTWPGSPASVVNNITFEGITMNKVSFPIIIDQNYCPAHHCTDKPSSVAISNIKYKGIKGTSFTKLAVNLICSQSLKCKGIELSDIQLTYQGTGGSTASMCQNVRPVLAGRFSPAGSCSSGV